MRCRRSQVRPSWLSIIKAISIGCPYGTRLTVTRRSEVGWEIGDAGEDVFGPLSVALGAGGHARQHQHRRHARGVRAADVRFGVVADIQAVRGRLTHALGGL